VLGFCEIIQTEMIEKDFNDFQFLGSVEDLVKEITD
jgi:hypothetical protein